MGYVNAAINESATIVDKAASQLSNSAMLAAVFSSGKLAIASTAGEVVAGIIIPNVDDTIAADDDVTIVVKDITLWKAGGAIAKGQEVMTDANGKAAVATSGSFVVGYALDAATAAGEIIRVQVVKAGYKPSGETPITTLAGLTDVNLTTPEDNDTLTFDTATDKWVNSAAT